MEEEYKQHLKEREAQLEEELEKLRSEGVEEEPDPNITLLKGTDYVMFDIVATIPEMHFCFKDGEATELAKIEIATIQAVAKKGIDFLDSSFSLQYFCIVDLVTKSPVYKNLIELNFEDSHSNVKRMIAQQSFKRTEEDEEDENQYALFVKFQNNPRFPKTPLRLKVKSDYRMFVFANMLCLNALKSMFAKAVANNLNLTNFYKEAARSKAFAYMTAGTEYMSEIQTEEDMKKQGEIQHTAVLVDLQLNAPTIFVTEDYYALEGKSCLVVDLGVLSIKSEVVEIDKKRDYSEVTDPAQLYDSYYFEAKGFQVMALEELTDYKKYREAKMTKLIRDITLVSTFYNNVWPAHPTMPVYEIHCSLRNFDMIVSDYISHFLQRLNEAVQA